MTAIYPLLGFWISLEVAARLERTEPPTVQPVAPKEAQVFYSVDLIEAEPTWDGDEVKWGEW